MGLLSWLALSEVAWDETETSACETSMPCLSADAERLIAEQKAEKNAKWFKRRGGICKIVRQHS